MRPLELQVVELSHLVGGHGVRSEEGRRWDARVLHPPTQVVFERPQAPQIQPQLFLLGLELHQLLEVGLLVAGQVEVARLLALLVNDALQAVHIGLDLDELGLDELVRLAVDLLPRRRGVLDVPGGQRIQEFDGPLRPDVVDLKLEDARLAHAADGQASTVLADDLVVVAHLESLPLRDGLLDGAAAL